MKTIQTHAKFYVELSPDEIRVCPKYGYCSTYPIWLGKNRAVMREALAYFAKNPPQTWLECIELLSRLGLNGMSSRQKSIPELFVDPKEDLDNDKVFW